MNAEIDLERNTSVAAKFLQETAPDPVSFGVILGTGSGIVAEKISIDHEIDYGDIPHFPKSTALGHKGSLIFGNLENQKVVAMNGRFHLYEGHTIDSASMAVRVMHRLGVRFLFVTNAAGGLNPKFSSGDVMIIDSHIDLMFRAAKISSVDVEFSRPLLRTDTYDKNLAQHSRSIARSNNFQIQTGVYAGLLGPNYETRAEYRMLRRIGADVAGMSTIPEVNVAAMLGLRVLGLSIVTNVAKPDVLDVTSGQEVVEAAELAAPHIHKIISGCIRNASA